MKVDVSEIKTFRACKRQWQLSSRNQFHLRPRVTPPQFALGTLFHECLAQLYLEVPLEKVMEMVKKEMKTDNEAALLAMVPGYAKEVLPMDLERFKVLDIEHHFDVIPTTSDGEVIVDDLHIVGSIDMIVLEYETNLIFGFEHKTCKSFRDESYLWMDEQPRVYTWALEKYVQEYNERKYNEWLEACAVIDSGNVSGTGGVPYPEEPTPAGLGGIYLNEVKKLLRQFQYHRVLCTYGQEDMDNFMEAFLGTAITCQNHVEQGGYLAPSPSYFNCQMCNFKTICSTYMYANLDKVEVLDEFAEEFEERAEDHLEEKAERSGADV